MPEPLRIAMWSGPRNLSTAMMRSFGNRSDTFVSDEPYYGAFLKDTGAPHPMREAVIASYLRQRETAEFEDFGLDRQAEFFEREADRLGEAPPVVDAGDVLADP